MNAVVDLTEAEWDANMDVNAKGISSRTARQCGAAAGGGQGRHRQHGLDGRQDGCSAPGALLRQQVAVVGFTQSLAKEVGGDGIRVNCVCPGYVRTSMQDRELCGRLPCAA